MTDGSGGEAAAPEHGSGERRWRVVALVLAGLLLIGAGLGIGLIVSGDEDGAETARPPASSTVAPSSAAPASTAPPTTVATPAGPCAAVSTIEPSSSEAARLRDQFYQYWLQNSPSAVDWPASELVIGSLRRLGGWTLFAIGGPHLQGGIVADNRTGSTGDHFYNAWAGIAPTQAEIRNYVLTRGAPGIPADLVNCYDFSAHVDAGA